MKLSFRLAQRIGIGILLGIMGTCSLVSVLAVRATVADLRRYHSVLQVKADCFDELAFRHLAFQTEFTSLDEPVAADTPASLREHLDEIRRVIADLEDLPLSSAERESVGLLAHKEQRLRTITDVFVAAGDLYADHLPPLRAEVSHLARMSVDRTAQLSLDVSRSLRVAGASIDQAARRTLKILVFGTIVTLAAGIGVTIFLTRSLSSHVGRILRGTRELADGHLDYRINSPFSDAMGQLAEQVDQMAVRLQQSALGTEAILSHLPVGVVLIDESGKVCHINGAAMAMLGIDHEDQLLGRECHGAICEIGCCSVLDPSEAAESYEAEALRSDGTRIDVLKSVIPLQLDGKTVLLESFVDITQRKRAEEVRRESEARFKTLFEHAGDAIMIHDSHGRVLDVNQEACNRLGYGRRELLHMTLSDIEAAETDEPVRTRLETLGPDSPLVYETSLIRRDGTRVAVEVIARAFDFAGRPAVLSIARDITERKQVERQLQLAKESAEANSQAKSDFLARMSHEIRTPINGVIGMTDLALDTQTSAEQSEYLQTIKESADSLLTIVNDILDFSKIEAGKVELESVPFSLRECICSAIRSFGSRADEQDLELLFNVAADVPDPLVGDPGRIRQILVNLVGNAVKFTAAGQVSVRVEADGACEAAVDLHMIVQDTGIGIEAPKRKTIFEAFEQADGSTTRRYGGTGLGLAITADLAKLMGGRIWVESESGHGSAFHVRIRVDRQLRVSHQATWLQRRDLKDMPVLVVDDNPTGREFLLASLAQWQMRSMPAVDAVDAMEKLRSAAVAGDPFALILLDASLGDTDGFDIADTIAADEALGAKVVMIFRPTRWQDAGDRVETGVIAAHLTKPVDPAHLSEAISHALNIADTDAPHVEGTAGDDQLDSLHIVLADDNRANRVLIERLLTKRGHQVAVADNGADALELWRRHAPDVVITDLQMPGLTGLELTAAIRAAEAEGAGDWHTPIIAMTAHAFKGARESYLAAGMDGYVSKPVTADQLYAALRKTVEAAGIGSET